LKELVTTNQPLRRVAISPDGQRMVAVADRTAWVWELPSGKVIRVFPDPIAVGTADAIPSPRGKGQGEGKGADRAFTKPAELTSDSTPPQRKSASALTSPIAAVFADDTGEHFASIDSEGRLTLWRPGQAPQHLVYGREVREWWYDPAKGDTETTDRARVVWTGLNPVAHEYGRRLRLYLNTRENPRPDMKIASFDFVSAMTHSAPFLIAVAVD
jgi:hypothetical protein